MWKHLEMIWTFCSLSKNTPKISVLSSVWGGLSRMDEHVKNEPVSWLLFCAVWLWSEGEIWWNTLHLTQHSTAAWPYAPPVPSERTSPSLHLSLSLFLLMHSSRMGEGRAEKCCSCQMLTFHFANDPPSLLCTESLLFTVKTFFVSYSHFVMQF